MVYEFFEVCGTPTLQSIEAQMQAVGYRRVYERPSEPGEYSAINIDAAPGWSDWQYEVQVVELPDHPIAEILERFRGV